MYQKIDVEMTIEGGVGVVEFKVPMITDVEAVSVVSRQIKEFIEREHPKMLIVDFEGVKFFSSQLLGLLLNVRSKLDVYGGEVLISAINPQLYRVFKITNLDNIFRFFPDKENAIEALSAE